jgi:tetratricopeptide (TPR) repeat protein
MRFSFILVAVLSMPLPLCAQRGGQTVIEGEIRGQVRIGERAAPEGVLVLLDTAPSFTAGVIGNGEIARTMTDSAGKFTFDHLRMAQGEQIKFLVTVHCPGYRDISHVAELKGSPRAFVDFELHRDTSGDTPNVPPGGPAETVSARQPSSSKAQEELAKGEHLLIEKRDPKASIKNFTKLIELDPQYGPGYVLLGTAHMQLQEWGDARSAFEKAVKLEPANASALLGIGITMNQQHDFTGAQKTLMRCLELNPNSAEGHYELGRSLWAQSKWQEAEPHVRQAIIISKDFAPAHVLMGNIYLRRRDANAATAEFQEYLRLDPQGQYAEAVKQMISKIQKALQQR